MSIVTDRLFVLWVLVDGLMEMGTSRLFIQLVLALKFFADRNADESNLCRADLNCEDPG